MAEEHNQYAFREWQQAGLVAFLAGMSANGRKLVSGQDGVRDLPRDAGEVSFPTLTAAELCYFHGLEGSDCIVVRSCGMTGPGIFEAL